jgi:putative membrane protein
MTNLYLWIKTLHVLALIAWMAGMLYLPRLFVYHADVPVGSPQSETFKVMEAKLLRLIMLPAMIVTWITGLILAYQAGFFVAGWLHAKLLLVLLMSGVHGYLSKTRKVFAADANTRPGRFYRVLNEVPTVLLIGIVILVVVKPF